MMWIKLQAGQSKFWLELSSTSTEEALTQIKGLELGAELFSPIPVRVLDTRLSKHPTEPLFQKEIIQQLIKEQVK
jgi:hypothetical protein